MPDFTLGQEVRVFDINGARAGQPPGGWVGLALLRPFEEEED